jgi:endonuclease YncB( thermonuclease family)
MNAVVVSHRKVSHKMVSQTTASVRLTSISEFLFCARRWRRLSIVLATTLAATGLSAQTPATLDTGCKLETIGTGAVRRVIDGRTFQLDDGQHVRLAAVEVPPMPLPGQSGPQAKAGLAAKAALETLLVGRAVMLTKLGPNADRYGRIVALVSIDGAARSVQQDMLAQGHALVAAEIGERTCAPQLFAAEHSARSNSLGLWGIPYYVIQQAKDPAKVMAERGRFTLVEGKVLSVRESGATIYVNFGRRWSEDFTVTILKRNARTFAAEGIEPRKLTGRQIRVRGVIEERGGPWIEATRPEQIELAEQN